jgi:DNA-binding NarL/FixJ family response regulator
MSRPKAPDFMPIKVSIVEDDPQVCGSFACLVDASEDCRCISQHGSVEQAIAELPKIAPDVVLMDINLPGMNGVSGVYHLKKLLPKTQFVMLTVYEDSDLIFSALKVGATGYLLKRSAPTDLIAAIREVQGGGSPMTSQIARKIVQSFQLSPSRDAEMQKLSARESEVLHYLAQGYLYKEIADVLKISYTTVNTHIRHIYEKLHVTSRTEAVSKHLRARQTGVTR